MLFSLAGICIYFGFSFARAVPSWAPCLLMPCYALYVYISVKQAPNVNAFIDSVLVRLEQLPDDDLDANDREGASPAVKQPDSRTHSLEPPIDDEMPRALPIIVTASETSALALAPTQNTYRDHQPKYVF